MIWYYNDLQLYVPKVFTLGIACSFFSQGTSLSSACDSGQVTFLDGLKLVSDSLKDDSEEGNNADDINPFRNLRYILFLTTSVSPATRNFYNLRARKLCLFVCLFYFILFLLLYYCYDHCHYHHHYNSCPLAWPFCWHCSLSLLLFLKMIIISYHY